jgi:hypothetical protein
MDTDETTSSRKELISERIKHNIFESCACSIYNRKAWTHPNDSDMICPCGRLLRSHSFNGACAQPTPNDPKYNYCSPPEVFRPNYHTIGVPVSIFRRLKLNGCKFLQIDYQSNMRDLYIDIEQYKNWVHGEVTLWRHY